MAIATKETVINSLIDWCIEQRAIYARQLELMKSRKMRTSENQEGLPPSQLSGLNVWQPNLIGSWQNTAMPKGPKGEKRPADVIGAVIMVAKIATGTRHIA
jgi:hypothetical protein